MESDKIATFYFYYSLFVLIFFISHIWYLYTGYNFLRMMGMIYIFLGILIFIFKKKFIKSIQKHDI